MDECGNCGETVFVDSDTHQKRPSVEPECCYIISENCALQTSLEHVLDTKLFSSGRDLALPSSVVLCSPCAQYLLKIKSLKQSIMQLCDGFLKRMSKSGFLGQFKSGNETDRTMVLQDGLVEKEENSDDANDPLERGDDHPENTCVETTTEEQVPVPEQHVEEDSPLKSGSKIESTKLTADKTKMVHQRPVRIVTWRNTLSLPEQMTSKTVSHKQKLSGNIKGKTTGDAKPSSEVLDITEIDLLGKISKEDISESIDDISVELINSFMFEEVTEENSHENDRGKSPRKRGNPSYVCDDCGKTFKSQSTLVNHRRTHTGEKPFHCDQCPKSFSQRAGLNCHMERHHGGTKRFQCSECDQAYWAKEHLQTHMRNAHTFERPYLCEECGKGFLTKSVLKVHMQVHNNKLTKCPDCDYETHSPQCMDKHVKVKHGLQQQKICEICGRKLKYKASYINHMKRHQGHKTVKCMQCNASFINELMLRKHQKRSHMLRMENYRCTECNKTFPDRYHLKRHESVHSGVKPHGCPECKYTTALVPNLRKHCKNVHKLVYPPLIGGRVMPSADAAPELSQIFLSLEGPLAPQEGVPPGPHPQH